MDIIVGVIVGIPVFLTLAYLSERYGPHKILLPALVILTVGAWFGF